MFTSRRISGVHLVHPNEKPLGLMVELVESITKTGDFVLDPFLGSGSTGVAAMNTGRAFVGMELDQTYFDIAKARVKAAQEAMASALQFPAIEEAITADPLPDESLPEAA